MNREELLERLEWVIEYFNASNMYLWPDEKEKLLKAVTALRDNPCDRCVGPGLAIAHGYKDMRTKKLWEG